MTSSRPVTPASPRVFKVKAVQPGVPLFGCKHVEQFLNNPDSPGLAEKTSRHYKDCLRTILDHAPVLPHTTKSSKGKPFTTLTPNYLCIQCNVITTAQGRIKHGEDTRHRFYVESRTGCLFCQMCDDFVWDPTLEEMRLRKLGTGSFTGENIFFDLPSWTEENGPNFYSADRKKRKHGDLFTEVTDTSEDPRFIQMNTIEAPCRASGIRGIYNMGATCYMNVILQSIVHNPLLRNFYLGDKHGSSECNLKNCMSCEMDAMFQSFFAEDLTTGYGAPNILACFWLSKRKAYEELASNKEQDAHEFFQFLTEELHEINSGGRPSIGDETPTPKRLKTGSETGCECIVHQTFYGKSQSTITCQSCRNVNTSVESFLDLSLGLDVITKKKNLKATSLSLQKCLDVEYKNPERCEYNCHVCGNREAQKELSIKSLPNVLCIQLKRFKQFNGSASKIDTKVSFPLKLEMFPYTSRSKNLAKFVPKNKEEELDKEKMSYELARGCSYDLQSVVVHVGELETGHYVSYSRVGNQWFKFNDHNVTLASKSQVLNEQAFLLFYVIQSLA